MKCKSTFKIGVVTIADETVIVSAVRTPFGRYGGKLQDIPATDLAAECIREVLSRVELPGDQVDYALLGMVVQAGAGQIPSRQATMKAGLPASVPSDTINKVCASSLRAVNLADAMIRSGEAEVIIAGGMESMSRAPYLADGVRWGLRMGDAMLTDAVLKDGLICAFGGVHMGVYGTQVAREYGITREEMDRWALRSHQRAARAYDEGLFADEVIPIAIPQRKGEPVVLDQDESIRRDTTYEKLSQLKPVFEEDGLITAGNAPPLNDGAAAMLLMSRQRAEALGIKPLATIISQGQVSLDPPYLHTVPYYSGRRALERIGMTEKDLDLVEINEAFAAVTLTSMKLGGWDPERVNVNGGAVAIGHPVGASGARILMTLVYELKRRGGGYGLAAICSGGGQGEATVVRVDA